MYVMFYLPAQKKAEIQPFLVPRSYLTKMHEVLNVSPRVVSTRTEEWRKRECKVPGALPQKVKLRFGGDLLKRALEKTSPVGVGEEGWGKSVYYRYILCKCICICVHTYMYIFIYIYIGVGCHKSAEE